MILFYKRKILLIFKLISKLVSKKLFLFNNFNVV